MLTNSGFEATLKSLVLFVCVAPAHFVGAIVAFIWAVAAVLEEVGGGGVAGRVDLREEVGDEEGGWEDFATSSAPYAWVGRRGRDGGREEGSRVVE